MSCPSNRPAGALYQLGSQWTAFREMWHWRLLWKYVKNTNLFKNRTKNQDVKCRHFFQQYETLTSSPRMQTEATVGVPWQKAIALYVTRWITVALSRQRSVFAVIDTNIRSSTIHRESMVSFPFQKWLRERARVTLHVYCLLLVVCLCVSVFDESISGGGTGSVFCFMGCLVS